MNITYITAGDETRASTRYRVLYATPHLRRKKIDVNIIVPKQNESWITRRVNQAPVWANIFWRAKSDDIIVIQKRELPPEVVNLLSKASKNLVYDFDDAAYATKPWENEKYDTNRRLQMTLSMSDYVITGNPELQEYAKKFCKRAYLAPTGIPKGRYTSQCGKNTRSERNGETTIGWIGNEENLWYLQQQEEALERVLESYNSVELLVITSANRPYTPLKTRIGKDVRYVEWSEKKELEYLSQVDIGIRPLTDDRWTRGKGGYTSVVQLMAMKCPVVVTPVGELKEIVEDKRCGIHAETHKEWVEGIGRLVENEGLRNKMGKEAFKRVGERELWLYQYADNVAEIFNEIASSDPV